MELCHWLCLWDVLQRGCKKRNQIFILFCLLVCFKIRGKVPRGSPQCCCASLAAVVLGGAVRIPVLAPKVPISGPKMPLQVPALAPLWGDQSVLVGFVVCGGFVWDHPGFLGTHHSVRGALVLRGIGALECCSPNVRAQLRVSYCFPFT